MLVTANKEMQFWAEMRSTAYLFSKSSWPSAEQTGKLISQLNHILGKRIIKYPQVLREFGIGPETPYHLKKAFLGIQSNYQNPNTEECDKRFLKFMEQKAAEALKGNWSWRIAQEARQKQLDGWYPFFTTLTIDPKRCDGRQHYDKDGEPLPIYNSPRELWEKGREFRKYIRRLSNVVTTEMEQPEAHKKAKNYKGKGIDYDYRPESDYITYAGVLEHGKTNEHHHMHLLIWMKEIPSSWKIDPNQGRINKTERENKKMRHYWPWSIATQCPSLYFRSKGDVWSKLGHVVPLDKKSGKPLDILQVESAGNYIIKYMQKGTRLWHHRMKATRNLGLKKIQNLINKIPLEQLKPLAWKPEKSQQLRSVSLIHSVPQGIVRSLATRRIFAIRYHLGALELKDLMKTNYEHYRKMLKSVRDGARPDRMPSPDFYDWVQKFLPDQPEYCEKRLLDSHRLLAYDFPRRTHTIKPTVQGANEIGFTQCI